jgi:hypothetical protein
MHKALNGVPEEWLINYRFNPKDLERIMFRLNIDNIYAKL